MKQVSLACSSFHVLYFSIMKAILVGPSVLPCGRTQVEVSYMVVVALAICKLFDNTKGNSHRLYLS